MYARWNMYIFQRSLIECIIKPQQALLRSAIDQLSDVISAVAAVTHMNPGIVGMDVHVIIGLNKGKVWLENFA